MKVVCEGINLSEAVLKVVKACAVRTTVPLLECIKLTAHNDGLTLSATDGEISIQKTVKAEVYEEGENLRARQIFFRLHQKTRRRADNSRRGRRQNGDYVCRQPVVPASAFGRRFPQNQHRYKRKQL